MKISKEISKIGSDGLCQIKVRAEFSRSIRPRMKTGIFIHPELWDEDKETIKIPKRGRSSAVLLEEATKADEQLSTYCLNLTKIINA